MAAEAHPNIEEFPALCAYFRLKQELQFGAKEEAALAKMWSTSDPPVRYDDWVRVYYQRNVINRRQDGEKPYCTLHNHVAGKGCARKESCSFEHKCLVCDSTRHGTFFRNKKGKFYCPIVEKQFSEMENLEKQGFQESDLKAAWHAHKNKCLFDSQVGTIQFVHETSQLTVTGFPRKTDIAVFKGTPAVIKAQLDAKGISNGGVYSTPATEKKHALVFVLYY
ncbi:MAG: hypothetical protein ACOVQN_03860 [Exiguobacterium sp.]